MDDTFEEMKDLEISVNSINFTNKMPEINLEVKTIDVDAGNLNEEIDKLLKKKVDDDENKNVSMDQFWAVPLKKQIETLSEKWADLKSDGKDGKIYYIWRTATCAK